VSDGPLAMRWVVRGRVQGVGFRYFVRACARQLGLVGRVRNLPGGEVEIEAAGEAGKVRELAAEVRQGPPGARVLGIEEHALPDVPPGWDAFDIDRYR
jgi:acylphosphatase